MVYFLVSWTEKYQVQALRLFINVICRQQYVNKNLKFNVLLVVLVLPLCCLPRESVFIELDDLVGKRLKGLKYFDSSQNVYRLWTLLICLLLGDKIMLITALEDFFVKKRKSSRPTFQLIRNMSSPESSVAPMILSGSSPLSKPLGFPLYFLSAFLSFLFSPLHCLLLV